MICQSKMRNHQVNQLFCFCWILQKYDGNLKKENRILTSTPIINPRVCVIAFLCKTH